MRMLKLSCLQGFSGTLKSTCTFSIMSGWIWVLTSDSMAQVCLAVVAFLFFLLLEQNCTVILVRYSRITCRQSKVELVLFYGFGGKTLCKLNMGFWTHTSVSLTRGNKVIEHFRLKPGQSRERSEQRVIITLRYADVCNCLKFFDNVKCKAEYQVFSPAEMTQVLTCACSFFCFSFESVMKQLRLVKVKPCWKFQRQCKWHKYLKKKKHYAHFFFFFF